MPQNVTAVTVGSREINLTWVAPDNDNASLMYHVRYMAPEFVTGDRERVVNTSTEMASIGSLFPGVNYTFRVSVVNENGQSDPLTVRTMDEGELFITSQCERG